MAAATTRKRLERILIERFGMVYVKNIVIREDEQSSESSFKGQNRGMGRLSILSLPTKCSSTVKESEYVRL